MMLESSKAEMASRGAVHGAMTGAVTKSGPLLSANLLEEGRVCADVL